MQPGISYRCRFATVAGCWLESELPFDDFVLMRYGQRAGVNPVQPERISSVSILIADKIEGPFALELEEISLWHR